MRRCFIVSMMIVTLAGLAGCTPWATYPRVKGMTEIGSPATEPVPTLMARAISYIRENECDGAQYAVNLPPGVSARTYEKVFEDLEYSRHMMSSAELAYHVTEVRLRGLNAEVDVMYPDKNVDYQLTTVTFRNSVVPGWNVVDTRTWNIHITVPGPNYEPAQEVIVTETESDDSTP